MENPLAISANGIKWGFVVHGTEVAITSCVGLEEVFSDIETPQVLDGRPVTRIGDYAFVGNFWLKRVTIPYGVTSIGVGAFGECVSLERIVIPDSVTEIGSDCFYYCENLKSIRLSRKLKTFSGSVFFGCVKLSAEVPEGVQEIKDGAMLFGTRTILPRSLRRIDLPDDFGKWSSFKSRTFLNWGLTGKWCLTEFVWMGSPDRVEGAQRWIDVYDQERGDAPEVSFMESPLYKDTREVAATLLDMDVPLNKRVSVWRKMMSRDFSIPCPSSPRRVTVPDVMFDHPFGRYWCCMKRCGGYKDLCCSVPAVIEAHVEMTDALRRKWPKVIGAIEDDAPGKIGTFFLDLALRGTKLPKPIVMYALRMGSKRFVRALYEKCPKSMLANFSIRSLLLYHVSNWNLPEAIEYVRMIADISPDLIRDTIDARGNSALWYTLYRAAEGQQMWPSTFSAENELATVLIELGCSPECKNMLGLSWADVVGSDGPH